MGGGGVYLYQETYMYALASGELRRAGGNMGGLALLA